MFFVECLRFLPTGGAVVELFNYNHFQPMYRILAQAFGLSHWTWQNMDVSRHQDALSTLSDYKKENRYKYGNTRLDVEQVVALVGRAITHVVREREFVGGGG